jgi:sec-independent protein translocase protein TatA
MWPIAIFGGPADVAIVAVVVLVLFGGPKLRDFARSAGEGIKEFKHATQDDEPKAATPPPTNTTGTTS